MAPCSLLLLLLLFLLLSPRLDAHPSSDKQVVNMFGSHLLSLIMAPPNSDDITEGSAESPAPSSSTRGLAARQKVVPRVFLDFLQINRRLRGRSRKSMAGGRGCFGMKMDRIGSLSGLGC
ncbi:unnamed protein product [Merluccius merluccius]